MPGVAQVVPIGVSHGDQRLYGVDVLLLHLGDAGTGRQQRESGQGLNVRISFQLRATTSSHFLVLIHCCGIRESAHLHAEDGGDPDGTSDALQAQGRHLWVVAVLQAHAKGCQQRGPCQLWDTEHSS